MVEMKMIMSRRKLSSKYEHLTVTVPRLKLILQRAFIQSQDIAEQHNYHRYPFEVGSQIISIFGAVTP